MVSNNPLANESRIDVLKKMFKGSKGAENAEANTGSIVTELVGMSRGIDIISEACACCWDKTIPDDYPGRAEYVAKRTRTGHTSILEHSNFVMYLRTNDAHIDDLIDYLDWNRFLHHKMYKNNGGDWCILLGGSYRGFSDVYLNTDDLNNSVLKAVAGCLYTYAPSAAFEDICAYGLMDKSRFIDAEPDDVNFKILTTHYNDPDGDEELFKIVGLDDVRTLYTNLHNIDAEFAESLTTADLLEFVTVTVLFKNMSRTCTHQLVRHRNGVTQESQRYVDYSKACFTSPAKFKPGKYDEEHKYTVRFGSSANMYMTLDEIGEAICNLYEMLSNPAIAGKEYALLREDARGYLPGNVQCRKLYMTFTYRMMFKYMQLREASGAQAEIRAYTIALATWIRNHTNFTSKEVTDLYTKPKLLIEDPFKLEAYIGEEEFVVGITEEDYIKATGLDREDAVENADDMI